MPEIEGSMFVMDTPAFEPYNCGMPFGWHTVAVTVIGEVSWARVHHYDTVILQKREKVNIYFLKKSFG